jgi:hypothetical protein
MALDINRPKTLNVSDLEVHFPIESFASRAQIEVINLPNYQEATLRKLITPKTVVDQEGSVVQIISQGLSLSEEKRTEGQEAILIEVAARYRRGEGAIKQIYRYLVFSENNHLYCQRLPMGSWAPGDPDVCFAWLGRGGFQQGDFVLLPRKRVPLDSIEIPKPPRASFLQRTVHAVSTLIGEILLDEPAEQSEWERTIGRHDPVDCKVYRKEAKIFLEAPNDTVSNHPEHAQLYIPKGIYEVVEDRASTYWRKAID